MANENITFIPGRIKSAAKNDPYIAGVEDIEGAIGGIPDKEYDPEKHSGLGRKTLKLDGDSNVITQDDFNQENTIYDISYDFDLNGETIEIPEGCILYFEGGSLNNGTIIGQDTYINDVCGLGIEALFGEGITREGTWRINEGGGSFEQVQSDWNQDNPQVKDFIKNKPTLATVATSGNYNDLNNKPTIPEEVTVDTALSKTSTNPVQNKVVTKSLEESGSIDKSYDPTKHSGLGRKILQLKEDGSNVLTQEDFDAVNTIYVIQYDFVLGEDITVPANCILDFQGGSLSGAHTITGQNTDINAGLVKIFDVDVEFGGTWNVIEVYPEWFGATCEYVSNTPNDTEAVRKSLKFSQNHKLVFSKGKTYYMGYPEQEDYRGQVAVYSNTEIVIDGTIAYTGFGSFAFFDMVTSTPRYSGTHDVYIHGSGLYNSNANSDFHNPSACFRVHHCSDIRIEDITIQDYLIYHAIEIGGSQRVTIRNVVFHGGIAVNQYLSYAIQIETITNAGTGGAIPYDDTISRDITIDGCLFRPSERTTIFYGAIGTMHGPLSDGDFYENITIRNCIFDHMYSDPDVNEGVRGAVIKLDYNHKDTVVENNTFIDCNCAAIKGFVRSKNVRIKGNCGYNIGGSFIWLGDGSQLWTSSENRSRNIIVEDNFVDGFSMTKSGIAGFFLQCGSDVVIFRKNIIKVNSNDQMYVFHVPNDIYSYIDSEDGSRAINVLLEENVISGLSNFSTDALTVFNQNMSRFTFRKTAKFDNNVLTYFDMDTDGNV